MKRIIISALTMWIIISGLSFVGAAKLFRKTGEPMDSTTLIICVLLGTIAGALDVRSSFRMPPVKLGKALELFENKNENENNEH